MLLHQLLLLLKQLLLLLELLGTGDELLHLEVPATTTDADRDGRTSLLQRHGVHRCPTCRKNADAHRSGAGCCCSCDGTTGRCCRCRKRHLLRLCLLLV